MKKFTELKKEELKNIEGGFLFLAIVALIAIGVGIYAGYKSGQSAQ